MIDLTGQTIMVTGATSGIGLATCHLIDELGGSVVMVGRNSDVLVNTQSKLSNVSYTEQWDLEQTHRTEEWFDLVIKKTGPLHGIAHCAGIQVIGPSRTMSISETEKLLNVNVTSGLVLAKCFRKKPNHVPKASLVFVSSVMGCVGAEFRSAYCASKGAVIAMTKSLALELVRDNVRVNCVSPGFVQTNMLTATQKLVGDEAMMKIEKLHPLGFGEPSDVASSIVFLLSPAAKWITGTNLVVDGGYTAQ